MNANIYELNDLFIEIDALKTSMELIINGSTPDHAKWVSYKNSTRKYSDIAGIFNSLTGAKAPTYDASKLKGHMSTLWPDQKKTLRPFITMY